MRLLAACVLVLLTSHRAAGLPDGVAAGPVASTAAAPSSDGASARSEARVERARSEPPRPEHAQSVGTPSETARPAPSSEVSASRFVQQLSSMVASLEAENLDLKQQERAAQLERRAADARAERDEAEARELRGALERERAELRRAEDERKAQIDRADRLVGEREALRRGLAALRVEKEDAAAHERQLERREGEAKEAARRAAAREAGAAARERALEKRAASVALESAAAQRQLERSSARRAQRATLQPEPEPQRDERPTAREVPLFF